MMNENNREEQAMSAQAEETATEQATTQPTPDTEGQAMSAQLAGNAKPPVKKWIAIGAVCAAIVIAFVVGTEVAEFAAERRAHQMQGQIIAQQAQSAGVNLISQADATAIALEAAGVGEADVRILSAYLDAEHGFYQYEISFVSGTYEYDFEIDAASGTIMESDIDSVFD